VLRALLLYGVRAGRAHAIYRRGRRSRLQDDSMSPYPLMRPGASLFELGDQGGLGHETYARTKFKRHCCGEICCTTS
jgi:hypothetical protein